MKVQVLVSTMHQTDHSLLNTMNIMGDAVVINQCDRDQESIIEQPNNQHVTWIDTKERGLSKSRNMAIKNSDADICIIADDDLTYVDDYQELIHKIYEECPDADIIAFDVPSDNAERPTNRLQKCEVSYLTSMKLASFQLSFKKKSLLDNDIRFNELFGAGSKHFTNGEENILLVEAIKKGLNVRYVDVKLATVSHQESTWYNGFDEKLFRTKGAMFYEMSSLFYLPLVYQFALRKHSEYKKEVSLFKAIRLMNKGKQEYKELMK